MAISGGSKSRAPCAPIRCCSASTSRRPASIRAKAPNSNELLLSIRDDHNTSILLIEHDMSVVMQISDHVVVLDYGVKISDGTREHVTQRSEGDRGLSRRRAGRSRRGRERRSGYDCATPLLAVRGVDHLYGNIIALHGVDLDVHDGEIVTLIGANGAGKSTLMMTIFGNPRASEGRIVYSTAATSRICRRTRSRVSNIAQAPEGRRIFSRMTVMENLQMGAADRRARDISRRISTASSRCFRA